MNTPAPRKKSYSRKHKLTRETELEVIKEAGKRLRTEHLEARVVVSLLSYCRAAIIVAKHGHQIVERNYLRRVIRELVRVRLIPFCDGMDVVVRALPNAYGVSFGQLEEEINQIQRQLSVVTPVS